LINPISFSPVELAMNTIDYSSFKFLAAPANNILFAPVKKTFNLNYPQKIKSNRQGGEAIKNPDQKK
jgi:hypothetical protein